MHICTRNLTIVGSDNGLSPGQHQAVIWTNDRILLNRTFRIDFSEILNKIQAFSFKNMNLNMSSVKWWQFSLGLNVLTPCMQCWVGLYHIQCSIKLLLIHHSSPTDYQCGMQSKIRLVASIRSFTHELGLHCISQNHDKNTWLKFVKGWTLHGALQWIRHCKHIILFWTKLQSKWLL